VDADMDHDGKLSFEEFKKWYAEPESAEPEGASLAAATEQAMSLAKARQLTNLQSYSVEDAFEMFAECADEEGCLSRSAFNSCFRRVIKSGPELSTSDKRAVESVVDRLFEIFDSNGDGAIDFSELASGLSVLCGGDREDKVEAAFALYDLDGDGTISLDEMTSYLTSVFKVLYETQPGTAERMGVSAEELASVTAEQAFVDADMDHDGKLSFEEFKKWYLFQEAPDTLFLSHIGLNRVCVLLKLDCFSVEEVFEILAEAAPQGVFTRSAFVRCCKNIIVSGGGYTSIDEQKTADNVVHSLFTLFDPDNTGVVDFGEMASGLSVMCGSTMDRKVEAAFSVFDIDGTGSISLEDMATYIESVFKVLFATDGSMAENIQATPGQLAVETAKQCFSDIENGSVDFDQFKSWCLQSMPDASV